MASYSCPTGDIALGNVRAHGTASGHNQSGSAARIERLIRLDQTHLAGDLSEMAARLPCKLSRHYSASSLSTSVAAAPTSTQTTTARSGGHAPAALNALLP